MMFLFSKHFWVYFLLSIEPLNSAVPSSQNNLTTDVTYGINLFTGHNITGYETTLGPGECIYIDYQVTLDNTSYHNFNIVKCKLEALK